MNIKECLEFLAENEMVFRYADILPKLRVLRRDVEKMGDQKLLHTKSLETT